jgi:hypothetical protein
MVPIEKFRQLALSFPETTEQPHFDKPSFRVGKKIFATLDLKNRQPCLRLSGIDQDVFSAYDKAIIFPVPNKWGKQGWTLVNLHQVHPEMFADALTTAYCEVAPKRLSLQVRPAETE